MQWDKPYYRVKFYCSNSSRTEYRQTFMEIIELLDDHKRNGQKYCVNAYTITSSDNPDFEIFYLED